MQILLFRTENTVACIACGGYEVNVRKSVRPYVLKPEAGDLAVVQTLESLRSL